MSVANNALTQPTRQPAGALATGTLFGFRLAQAAGWRLGAVALLPFACPLFGFSVYVLADLMGRPMCIDTRGGTVCRFHYDALAVGAAALLFGGLFVLAAWGLWRRGGAVRDIEILSEQVEGQ